MVDCKYYYQSKKLCEIKSTPLFVSQITFTNIHQFSFDACFTCLHLYTYMKLTCRQCGGSSNSDAETQTGNEYVAESLKQLPHKLDSVVTAIKTIQQQSELTRRHMQDLYEESKTEREDKKELTDTLSKQTQETIEVCTTRIATTMIEVMQNTNNKASTDTDMVEAKNNISYRM